MLGLVIDNNCIHRLGTIWHGCYGIVNRFASHTQITHNEIVDMHWDAIGLDARWNWKGEKYSHGNVVAYNHLHHLGLRYQTDAAGIYQFGPLDTHIHHNRIHATAAYPYICGFAGIYPLIQFLTRGVSEGPVTVSFAAMLHAATPAPFNVEFRGAGGTSEVGPALRFLADGRIGAEGQELLTVPPGTWTHVEIAFQLGPAAPPTYRLTLQHGGTSTQYTLPFRHDGFRDFRWLEFYGTDDIDGAFYLDDVKVRFGK